MLPANDAPTFDVPVASAPTTDPPRVPIRSVARNGQRVTLTDGLFFTMQGKAWRLDNTNACAECRPGTDVVRETLRPPAWGRQGVIVGVRPAGRLYTMDIVQGNASRVVYTVHVPGQPDATYEADVYRLPSAPGWTVAYVDYPSSLVIDKAWEETKLDVTFRAYDATGKYLPQVPPTHVPPKSPK